MALTMYTFDTDSNLRAMALAAVRGTSLTHFPARVLLTQWAIESKWGQRVTGTFNFGGIKRHPENGPAALCPTTELVTEAQFTTFRADERATVTAKVAKGGGLFEYHLSCWFASYASVDEYVSAYTAFILGNSRYLPAWHAYLKDGNEDALLIGIAKAGYATGAGYQTLELEIVHQQNIIQAVEMARQELGQ